VVLHPYPVEYLTDPTQAQLRQLAIENTPAVLETRFGNLNKISRNKARQASRTYIICDPGGDGGAFSQKLIAPEAAQALIDLQRRYIEAAGKLIEIRGYLGVGPRSVPVQYLYTIEGANIAGMQQILSFPRGAVEARLENHSGEFSPTFRVVYTPNCPAEGMDGEQAIIVDLDNYVTYIIGPDYFGESKKAALRMLNHWAFLRGALVLHAGAKSVRLGDRDVAMTIMGLSGTGKTTTTFSKQGDVTRPIQDDMVTLWPEGEVSITENGCFAKTFGLTEDTEPVIYRGTVSSDAWLENAYQDAEGDLDFFKEPITPTEAARLREVLLLSGADQGNLDRFIAGEVSAADVSDARGVLEDGWEFVKWTGNGRSIIPMSSVEDAADLYDIPTVEYMGILNRDEGRDAATPGIVKFASPEQAAGFFMLGETTKTSAAGKDVGKTRSPFTQPFFPLAHGLQAKRFSELAGTMPGVTLWMMNTGYVGGDAKAVKAGDAHKVKIRHSSAMLEAMLTDHVVWREDPDFGYLVVDVAHPDNAALVAAVPDEILNPELYYRRRDRMGEYRQWVSQMKAQRRAFLESYAVDAAIIDAACGASAQG